MVGTLNTGFVRITHNYPINDFALIKRDYFFCNSSTAQKFTVGAALHDIISIVAVEEL